MAVVAPSPSRWRRARPTNCRWRRGCWTACLTCRDGWSATAALPPTPSATGSGTSAPDRPSRHVGQAVQKPRPHRQFVGLARRQREGDGATPAIRNHAGLGAVAATRASQRFTAVALLALGPLFVGACRFLVGANVGAVQKGHAEGDPALLDQVEQALPDPEMRPADEEPAPDLIR